MAASSIPGVVDTTKPAKYPVILSDALLGKSSKEIYTGVRYNHRPTLSTDTAPTTARLKPATSNNATSFDLSYADDNGGKYAFNGTRAASENQYVLIFDPARKAFVLHRMDSTFNMNLTRTPTNTDPESLKEEYPHIDSTIKVSTAAKKGGAGKPKATTAKAKENKAFNTKKPAAARKEKEVPTSAPAGAAAAASAPKEPEKEAKKKRRDVESEEDDDDDDDGGLLVEYPEGEAPGSRFNTHRPDFSPAFPSTIRRFSEFVRDGQGEESDEDADAEYDEDDMLGEVDDEDTDRLAGFKLPSPVNNQTGGSNAAVAEPDIDDFEDDLEAELEKELEQASGMDVDSESSVSEED